MDRRSFAVLAIALLGVTGSADAATRCLSRQFDAYKSMVQPVPPEEMVRRHVGDHPMAPPDNPDVGDSWLWYTWRLAGYPVAELKMCTVRGEGQNVYVVVEDSQWLTRVNQEDVDAIIEAWDNSSLGIHPNMGIYEINTSYFGPAPDALDNDPKIYVLYYDFDVNADGFFWYFDQYPDGSQPFASNECEVLYLNSSDNDPGGNYLIAVQAHEFEHQIHWLADTNEVAWVDEGMAELAMWLYGYPDTISMFPNNPDNDLTNWTGIWADYIKTYLWSLYYYEQMGGGTLPVRTLMSEPANSTQGYENALAALGATRTFNDLFADWICANYLDDPTLAQGQYGYLGTDLPPFYAVVKNTYPVPPTNGSLNKYAADYIRFINGTPQRLWFDGADFGTWRARVLFIHGGAAQSVAEIPLDGVDYGSIDLFDFGETHDTAVLALAKYSPSGFTSYQYGTQAIPADAGDPTLSLSIRFRPAAPNPSRDAGSAYLELARSQQVEVRILAADGRLVRRLASERMGPGIHPIRWDGRDDGGRALAAGAYFVVATGEEGETVTRWIRVD